MAESAASHVAARAELKWAVAAGAVIVFLIGMITYMSLHWATMPPMRLETVDPTTLHLAGEFTEENLGSAVESDGSVTVRLVAAQYSFSPPCLLVPSDTPVTFRATSADVIHGFNIARTNVNLMLEPGYVSTFKVVFHEPGDHVMPCHEFCGVGHAAMWARVKVVARNDFLRRAGSARRLSCVD